MRAYREKPKIEEAADEKQPVQFLTDQGFIIVRRCDVDGFDPSHETEHCFVVRDMDGNEIEVTVRFEAQAAQDVITRGNGHVKRDSSFWIVAAERHLAEYLDTNGNCPPSRKLTIAKLDSALRWSADQAPDNNG